MSDEQMFDQLWTELNKPLNQMRARIRQLSKLTPRAEVAGALEVVDSLPSAGKKGRLLYDDSDDTTYVDDGSSWSPLGGGTPSGAMMPYGGSSAPSGWLLCAGQAVSRTTYAGLFDAIGTSFGAGDGSTTFNLPDLRGRMPAGLDNMGGTSANRVTDASADSMGGAMGEETHQLTISEMPSHDHVLIYNKDYGLGTDSRPPRGNTNSGQGSSSLPIRNTGGNGSHNNMQPTLFVNWIIKT